MGQSKSKQEQMFLSVRKTETMQGYDSCRDVSPVVGQNRAYAVARKGWKFSASVKQIRGGERDSSSLTYKCGNKGHVQRQCPGRSNGDPNIRGAPPGACPLCQ